MNERKGFKIFGIIFVVVGAIFLLTTFSGMTGFAVSEGTNGGSYIFGGLLLLIGIVLLVWGGRDEYEAGGVEKIHGRGQLNSKDLRDAIRWHYKQEHGKNPTDKEIRKYRAGAGVGELRDMVREYHSARKLAHSR
jgi:hypothetical protein